MSNYHRQLLEQYLDGVRKDKWADDPMPAEAGAMFRFARWLDERDEAKQRRRREASDSFTVPVQAAAAVHRPFDVAQDRGDG